MTFSHSHSSHSQHHGITITKSLDQCDTDETNSMTSDSSGSVVKQVKQISHGPKASTSNNDTKKKRRKRGKKNGQRTMKPTSKATSTVPYDRPMQKRDIYFALDCEMVGVGPEGLDSALARLSIINWDKELVLDTYVKVKEKVTDYRTFVSGIRQEHIESESAMTLKEVQKAASQILRGKILIGHGLENDLKVIGLKHPLCDIRDTATYEPYMQLIKNKGEQAMYRPRKLKDLAWETLGEIIQRIGTSHSPVEDAIATMELYKAARTHWEVYMMNRVPKTANVMVNYPNKVERPPSRFMGGFSKKVQPLDRSVYCMSPPPPASHQSPATMTSVPLSPLSPTYYKQGILPPSQPIGGPYFSKWTPTSTERSFMAQKAQHQARARANEALHYQPQTQF